MEFLTEELRQQLPKLGETKRDDATLLICKISTLGADPWIYYGMEFDGEDTLFGLEVGEYVRLTEFTLSQLQTYRTVGKVQIERDPTFQPVPLGSIVPQKYCLTDAEATVTRTQVCFAQYYGRYLTLEERIHQCLMGFYERFVGGNPKGLTDAQAYQAILNNRNKNKNKA